MNNLFLRLLPAAALCLPLLAIAQAGRADPADAKAPAPPLSYRSAFADYKPWQNLEPGNWRELNDKVAPAPGKSSGHAAHGPSTSVVPAAPAAPAAAKAPAPAASAGHGHGTHGGKR